MNFNNMKIKQKIGNMKIWTISYLSFQFLLTSYIFDEKLKYDRTFLALICFNDLLGRLFAISVHYIVNFDL